MSAPSTVTSTTPTALAVEITAAINRLPSTTRAAANAARTLIEPAGANRFLGAIQIVANRGVTRNADGATTVQSRTGGPAHRIAANGCDCKDAGFGAPIIAGRPACAHQIAAWITAKAAQAPATNSKSCWWCGSRDFTGEPLRGQAGRCRYCGTPTAPATPAVAPNVTALVAELYG